GSSASRIVGCSRTLMAPRTPMVANHTNMTGPNRRPITAVPLRCKQNSAISTTTASGRIYGATADAAQDHSQLVDLRFITISFRHGASLHLCAAHPQLPVTLLFRGILQVLLDITNLRLNLAEVLLNVAFCFQSRIADDLAGSFF